MNIWENIKISSGCWEWTGYLTDQGYAAASLSRKRGPVKISRHILTLLGVDIAGKNVLHHCDNPACVNPFHLYLGDQARNVADMVKRCRRKYTLTPADALELRHMFIMGATRDQCAARYGVTRGTANRAIAGITWKTAIDELLSTSSPNLQSM